MSRKLLSLTAAAVAVIGVTSVAATQAGGRAPAHTTRLEPVIIQETFTPLPCPGAPGHRTTLQMEGCAEKEILKSDTRVDLLATAIFAFLPDDRARRNFNTAQRAWLSYRKADCLSMSEVFEFESGTQAGLLDAQCVASRNTERVKDLHSFHRVLLSSG